MNLKKMNTIAKFGLAAVAAGAFFGGTLPANADQYASELSNPFAKHGLPVPGAYFKAKENQQTTTVAVSKSGQGVGEVKQSVSKVQKKRTHHVRTTSEDS
jgi:hypothetical protein